MLTRPTLPNLRAFLDQLRRGRDSDLVTVEAPVDARLEVAEIHRRVIAIKAGATTLCHLSQPLTREIQISKLLSFQSLKY